MLEPKKAVVMRMNRKLTLIFFRRKKIQERAKLATQLNANSGSEILRAVERRIPRIREMARKRKGKGIGR
jgi:hypothetical protein